MTKQNIFKFKFNNVDNKSDNFYINDTNLNAYKGVINSNNENIYLKGPKKSGKSYLANIWKKKNNAIVFKNNFNFIIHNKINVIIENLNKEFNEEQLFHIINHCKLNNLNIFVTSIYDVREINFKLKDLISRLKIFNFLIIDNPDDDMLINLLTKLFIEKQFVINSHEIFQFILKNANRSYSEMFKIVKKLDDLSIEKKRQLTIPLIKEIL